MVIAIAQTELEFIWASTQHFFYRIAISYCSFAGVQVPCQNNYLIIGILPRPSWYAGFFHFIDININNEMNLLSNSNGFTLGGLIPNWYTQPLLIFGCLGIVIICTFFLYGGAGRAQQVKGFLRGLQYAILVALPLPCIMYVFDNSYFWPQPASVIINGLLTQSFFEFLQRYAANALMLVFGVPIFIALFYIEHKKLRPKIKGVFTNRVAIIGTAVLVLIAASFIASTPQSVIPNNLSTFTPSGVVTVLPVGSTPPTGGIEPCAVQNCTQSGETVSWAFHVINGTVTTGYTQTNGTG